MCPTVKMIAIFKIFLTYESKGDAITDVFAELFRSKCLRTAKIIAIFIDFCSSSSSYELQHALHMRSIMHCFVRRGVRGYLNILVVVIVKF